MLKWESLGKENLSIAEAKQNKIVFIYKEFTNEDTAKQLLTRSPFNLFKSPNKWSECQKQRAAIVFK